MRSPLGISVLLALGLVLVSYQSSHKSQPPPTREQRTSRALMKTGNLQKIYLDEMPQQLALAGRQKNTLYLTGNLPSGAFKFDHTQVELQGQVIEVTPWAQYDAEVMAIQMLIPFADSVAVGPLAPGEYTVRFNSRTGTQTAKLEVK